MNFKLKLRPIKPASVGKAVVMMAIKPELEEIFEGMGEDRLRWLVESGVSMSRYLPQEKAEEYLQLGRRYPWANDVITNEDIVNCLPGWARQVLSSYDENKGHIWFASEIAWFRRFLKGGNGDGELQVPAGEGHAEDRPGDSAV